MRGKYHSWIEDVTPFSVGNGRESEQLFSYWNCWQGMQDLCLLCNFVFMEQRVCVSTLFSCLLPVFSFFLSFFFFFWYICTLPTLREKCLQFGLRLAVFFRTWKAQWVVSTISPSTGQYYFFCFQRLRLWSSVHNVSDRCRFRCWQFSGFVSHCCGTWGWRQYFQFLSHLIQHLVQSCHLEILHTHTHRSLFFFYPGNLLIRLPFEWLPLDLFFCPRNINNCSFSSSASFLI